MNIWLKVGHLKLLYRSCCCKSPILWACVIFQHFLQISWLNLFSILSNLITVYKFLTHFQKIVITHKLQLSKSAGNSCFYLALTFLKTWEIYFNEFVYVFVFLSTELWNTFLFSWRYKQSIFFKKATITHIKCLK